MNRPPESIGGILPVLYSFFDAQGALRPEGFRQQVTHCMEVGAGGVVLFGFVTQFYRLTFEEKRAALQATVAEMAGQGTVGVTVMEPSPEGQKALVSAAAEAGADWIILQPPLGPPAAPAEWLDLLVEVAQASPLPVAVQNAKIATTQLTNAQLLDLRQACPNVIAVKAETGAEQVADFAADHGARFRVLTGDWGVEYPFFLRAGVHGLIPAPNFVAQQVALHRAAQAGDWAQVEAIHAAILPLMQFFRERAAPEGQILLARQIYAEACGMDPGHNRRPGPQALDARILAHARHLQKRLEAQA
ncbi:dihydrodipicolinate synthase family protein [Pseudoruegeria sp. SHC-113]|uniref:dihydrodipicolinate synthase family protein n=1 Tax=Pseudoruegeria sp. SHC-113 TaxID=2855439 RepID=UPI0021BA5675|nr:dihydrodipicolinate synthase family protein [Pseudoruegeria sp. SHC-113]MCT8158683.1 dihydrodipicolinate synthase family protein [Pseudoruegeria sp. SHC-113]